jgi:hypothetical protein
MLGNPFLAHKIRQKLQLRRRFFHLHRRGQACALAGKKLPANETE